MSTHPLVLQLRFTRSEFKRALKGMTEAEARKRFKPMNCISWNVGHLAWQEQRYFVLFGQKELLRPDINELFAYGAPASTPSLKEMWAAWKEITNAADPWLDKLTTKRLLERPIYEGRAIPRIYGDLLQRTIYHYWYHIGENMAIRQRLKHKDLPQFVGNIDRQASYKPE
jgi:hypothetical protein